MPFNVNEPRLPAGGAGGGQWGAGGAPSKNAKPANAASAKRPAKKSTTKGASGWHGGPARNAAAAKVQANPQARAMYGHLMATPPGKRGSYVQGLSSSDLQLLTAIAYSSRTSDPKVVAARIAVANEMTKRGIDIKKHGALGGGLTASRKSAPAHMSAPHKAAAHAPRAAAPKPAIAKHVQAQKSTQYAQKRGQARRAF